jgi:hypothetical protein
MVQPSSVASEPLQSADCLRSGQLFERRVEDEQCIGRPSMSHTSDNVAKVKAV